MNNRKIFKKNLKNTIFSLAVISLSLVAAPASSASGQGEETEYGDTVVATKKFKGVAVTGFNNRFQNPVWHLGDLLGTVFMNWHYAYNPNGDEPFLVTADMPGDTVLASGVDSLAVALGLSPSNTDPSMINVPLHQTPITVALNGQGVGTGNRAQVPTALEYPDGSLASRSVPNDPITIDRWYSAKGYMKVKCLADGTANVRFKFSGLIPNGVYTLWAIYQADRDGDGNDDGVAPYPFAGVPNVVVPDKKGRARLERTIGYCPMEREKLKVIDLLYHSDGNVYGAVPDLAFDDFPQPMGIVSETHVEFGINVSPIDN